MALHELQDGGVLTVIEALEKAAVSMGVEGGGDTSLLMWKQRRCMGSESLGGRCIH